MSIENRVFNLLPSSGVPMFIGRWQLRFLYKFFGISASLSEILIFRKIFKQSVGIAIRVRSYRRRKKGQLDSPAHNPKISNRKVILWRFNDNAATSGLVGTLIFGLKKLN